MAEKGKYYANGEGSIDLNDEQLSKKEKVLKELTLREQIFVDSMTEPETYLNQTKSWLKASPYSKETTAASYGSTLIKKPQIRNAIQELLVIKGFGEEKRADLLSCIGNGDITTWEERIDKNGHVIRVNRCATITERLKALDLANKMDGTYEKNKTQADLAKDEFKRLQRDLLQDVRKGLKS